jgi:hypothetical protein
MRTQFTALASSLLLIPALAGASETFEHLPEIVEAVLGAVQISPHVPHMGEHWAEPANLPGGPIYCVIEGRIVCVEYMFEAEDLATGMEWLSLYPRIETPPISHIDVEFKSDGIGPRPVPLYQVHLCFAGKELLAGH